MTDARCTVWERMGEDGRPAHNHTEDGWSEEDEPTSVSEVQRRAWKGAIWRKRFAVRRDHEVVCV